MQHRLHAEAVRLAVVHAEIGAVERGRRFRAAHFLFSIGFMKHLNDSIFRFTGLVTPCIVSVPITSTGMSPSNLSTCPCTSAVGYFAASKNFGLLQLLVELVVASVDRRHVDCHFTVPVFAARSSVTVPLLLLNLPRHDRDAAEVIGLEAWVRVVRVELVRVGSHCVERHARDQRARCDQKFFFKFFS